MKIKILKISLGVLLLYILIHAFPQFLYGSKKTYKNFNIYSHEKLDKRITQILDSSIFRLQKSEFYSSDLKIDLFLCSNSFEFSFFSFFQSKSFAVNNVFFHHIFLNKTDVKLNRIQTKSKCFNTRTLTGVITHEVTHSFLRNHLGLWAYFKLNTWKNEGYADFIAKESSVVFTDLNKVKCYSPENPAINYYKYRLYIDYLINHQKKSAQEIFNSEYNLVDLEKKCKSSKTLN